jgi:hypothetical protein
MIPKARAYCPNDFPAITGEPAENPVDGCILSSFHQIEEIIF